MPPTKTPQSLLVGTWRSDRARTVAQWVFPKRLAAKRRKEFDAIFGKMQVRYSRTKHTTTYMGKTLSCPYRVLWSKGSAEFPQLILIFMAGNDETAQHVFFDSPNSYYIQGGKCAEFFKRVPLPRVAKPQEPRSAVSPNKSLQRSGTHKVLGRGRPSRERTRALARPRAERAAYRR
jgi:hypothetical protein